MAHGWLILADDLTGAADCAIAFGRRGHAAMVTWGDIADARDRRLPVLAYDAASRGLAAKAAAGRHADVLARLSEPRRLLFKKIDSTLRGQPAAEIAAVLAHVKSRSGSAFGVFAPAFPATIAITMGDPAGIGPEVIMKALALPGTQAICHALVIGDANRLRRAGQIAGVALEVDALNDARDADFSSKAVQCLDLKLVPDDLPFGRVSAAAGEAAYRYIEKAVQVVQAGFAQAICTAPLSKEALHAAGHKYPGHTELLAHLTGTPEVSMMLVSQSLRVIHVTTHIGLLDAIEKIEPGLVERVIARGHEVLVRAGIANPKIGVCAINPHAGENGLFGRGEEAVKITPAVEACQRRGWDVRGPLPADTLFFLAGRGDYDMVVAMYHDQGHGPVKVLGLEAGVNITVGLPVIRTSVDHGTTFDIAERTKNH